jgi:uncharacterized membrane protein
MMQWLRRSVITGLVVMVPLVISVAALVWIFGIIDGFTQPLAAQIIGPQVGALGRTAAAGVGILVTLLVVLLIGVTATNVIGRRVLARAESWLLLIPVFRTIYAPVKQLVVAFSPDNEYGFKRVVMVEYAAHRFVLGFLTKEFTVDRGQGPEVMIAVYVPTNHLYLGDVIICPRDRASYPDVTVEQGIRIFLTGGMALSSRIKARRGDDRVGDFRV